MTTTKPTAPTWASPTYARPGKPKVDKTGWVFPQANGRLPLHLGLAGLGAKVTIYGGPFRHYPGTSPTTYGVCLLEARMKTAEAWMPIVDFSIPAQPDHVVSDELVWAWRMALSGHTVYAGCAGGIGRTGVFLALMAKIAGEDDPVTYVRQHYLSHAVETPAQEAYIAEFDVREARKQVNRIARRGFFGRLFS